MRTRRFPLGPIELKRLVWLSIAAFGMRLAYFTGLSLGDDVFYALQSIAHARHLSWPPLPYHWQTRLGVTIPTSVSLAFFGLNPFAFVLASMGHSTNAKGLSPKNASDTLVGIVTPRRVCQ